MHARDLATARPQAKFAAYTGYGELIDGYSVLYWLDPAIEKTVKPNATVRDVTAQLPQADSAHGDQEWRTQVRRASESLGPPTCWIDTSEANWHASGATWNQAVGALDIVLGSPTPRAITSGAQVGGIAIVFDARVDTARRAQRITTPCGSY